MIAIETPQPAAATPALEREAHTKPARPHSSSPMPDKPAVNPFTLLDPRSLFFLGLLLAASGFLSPPLALLSGLAFGLTFVHPYRAEASALARQLLQIAVVLLGFGMNLQEVFRVGRSGLLSTALSITFAVISGLLLGKLLKVTSKPSYLITLGTAICGGSAIAAVAPILEANEQEISVSMGAVFLLNTLALLLFPFLGWRLHLTQSQFGLWAALAIHDTSSVVGAGAKYGSEALAIATTVKLARALWIIPVSLATAALTGNLASRAGHGEHRAAPIRVPWFIFLFLGASMLSTALPRATATWTNLNHLGKTGLTATLFLIGTTLTRQTLASVGLRPLLQGILLWAMVATLSLLAIHTGILTL